MFPVDKSLVKLLLPELSPFIMNKELRILRRKDLMKSRLFTDVKSFVKYIQSRNYVIECVILALLVFSVYYQIESHNKVIARLDKVEKKTDFRYFNLTRSLEDIHKVEIDTKNGRVVK